LTIVNRLENDPRFQTPVVPIENLPAPPGDRIAHIVGAVKARSRDDM